jgi:hypothetical protein
MKDQLCIRFSRAASTLSDFSQNIDVTIESPRFPRKVSFLQKVDGSIVTTLHIANPEIALIARVPSTKVPAGPYRRRHYYQFAGL